MINLVGKIFLAPNVTLSPGKAAVLIGEENSIWTECNEMEKAVGEVIIGKVFYSGPNYTEILKTNKISSAQFWMELLQKDIETIIYCDEKSLQYIYINWLLAIMPNIDIKRASFLYKMALDRYDYVFARQYNMFGHWHERDLSRLKKFIENCRELTFSDTDRMENFTFINDDILSMLPLENNYVDFLYAHLPFSNYQKDKLKDEWRESMFGLLMDLRSECLNCYDIVEQLEADQLPNDFARFLLESQLSMLDMDYLEKNYNVVAIKNELLKWSDSLPNPFSKKMVEYFSQDINQTFDTILESEVNSPVRTIIGQSNNAKRINNYFIDYATVTYFKNKDELKYFASARLKAAQKGMS